MINIINSILNKHGLSINNLNNISRISSEDNGSSNSAYMMRLFKHIREHVYKLGYNSELILFLSEDVDTEEAIKRFDDKIIPSLIELKLI